MGIRRVAGLARDQLLMKDDDVRTICCIPVL